MPLKPSPPSEQINESLADLVEEITRRIESHQSLDLEHLCRQHPKHAEQLRRLVPALRALDEANPTVHDSAAIDMPASAAANPRRELGDFRLIREIGRGGMGIVFEAEQLSLNRKVALKVLPFAAVFDAKQIQRFKNEARAAATLDHPNIVPVLSVGEERGVYFYAMSLVQGQSLAEVVAELRQLHGLAEKAPQRCVGPVSLGLSQGHMGTQEENSSSDSQAATAHIDKGIQCDSEAEPSKEFDGQGLALQPVTEAGDSPSDGSVAPADLDHDSDTKPLAKASISTEKSASDWPGYYRTVAGLGIQAAEALQHAHEHGVLHRDIKPGNLMVDHRGKLWITDFGFARLDTGAEMTRTGDVVGTLRYMSPEQALAKRVTVDQRSDIYSLGVTLYELLVLQPAFDAEGRQELFRQIAFDEPRRLRQIRPTLPLELETITLKAIRKNPDERYQSAQQVADDLLRFLENRPILAKPPGTWERARKWARRHPAWVAAAVLVFFVATLALTVTTVLVGIQRDIARDSAKQAEDRRLAAEHAYGVVREAMGLISLELTQSASALEGNGHIQLEQVEFRYRELIPVLEKLIREVGDEREVLEVTARTKGNLSYFLIQREAFLEAEPLIEDQLRLWKQLARRFPDSVHRSEYESRMGTCLSDLGEFARMQGDLDRAQVLFEQSIQHDQWSSEFEPRYFAPKQQHWFPFENLARVFLEMGQHASAAEMAEEILAVAPKDARATWMAAEKLLCCIEVVVDDPLLDDATRESLARDYSQRAEHLLQQSLTLSQRDPQIRLRVAQCYLELGDCRFDISWHTEAKNAYVAALSLLKLQLRDDPADQVALSQVDVLRGHFRRLTAQTEIAAAVTFIGNAGTDVATAVNVGPDGHVYVLGRFSGTVDFDADAGTTSLMELGEQDGFLARYTPDRQLVWCRRFGGADGKDSARMIGFDLHGNIYVVGWSNSSAPEFGDFSLTNQGDTDAYLAKLDPDGNFLWARGWGGADADLAQALHVDSQGNVYVVGQFQDTVDFDPGAAIFELTSRGDSDGFIVQFDGDGGFVTAIRMGGGERDVVRRVAVDEAGNIYAAGVFHGTAQFGVDTQAAPLQLTSAGDSDCFLWKIDPSGKTEWVRTAGGPSTVDTALVAHDGRGGIYFTGHFFGSIDFGEGTLPLTSRGHKDAFLSRWDPDGNLQWVGQLSGPSRVGISEMCFDRSGHPHLAGHFLDSADLDPGPGQFPVAGITGSNAFLLRLDDNGRFQTAWQVLGVSSGWLGVAVDDENRAYLAGEYAGLAYFPTGETVLSTAGSPDIFLLQLEGGER